MDATIRALLLASERTMTHPVDVELTHRAGVRDFTTTGAAVGIAGELATARGNDADVVGGRATNCSATGVASDCGALCRTTGAVMMLFGCGAGVSVSRSIAPSLDTVVRATLSGTTAIDIFAESAARAAVVRARDAGRGRDSRVSHATRSTSTIAAAPTPRQTYGVIGARSGLVPHQRQAPSDSR